MAIGQYSDGTLYSTHKWHQNVSIKFEEDKEYIRVNLKRFRMKGEDQEMEIKRKKVGIMTSQQKLDFVEDCLEKFDRDAKRQSISNR